MLLSLLKVSGHSMEPSIKSGSIVIISSVSFIFLKPKIGEIVLFKRSREKLIKRVIKIKGEKYFLTGDNVDESLDSRKIGWIKRKDILGKVIFSM